MKNTLLLSVCAAALVVEPVSAAEAPPSARRMSRAVLLDKIRGAWAGQMIGVSHGARTEFRWKGKIIEGDYNPEPVSNAINQDDLYVEMTFARVMDKVGLEATTEQYGEAFRDSQYSLWHANAGARRNLHRGIAAPLSGHPKYNIHADDIDFQIEADFIGIMCPGLPQEANKYADRVGHVMNYGDGVYGGMFVAGMYAAGFFESDPRKVVAAGLACIPAESLYGKLIQDLLDWSAQEPADWRKVWRKVDEKWNKDDPCSDGALSDFNIDAKLNGAYIAFGLLYGQGDFKKTMDVSTRCGQDSDCNPSSAAGVLGTMLGFSKIPQEYTTELLKLADKKFQFTDYSFNDIVASTEQRANMVIHQAGGKVGDKEVVIPIQVPKPPPLEQCNFGIPTQALGCKDAAWTWKGNWAVNKSDMTAGGAGSEATLKFTGTGVAIIGRLTQEGGRAEVFVDGEKSELIADAYIVERTHDNDLWHIHGLAAGEHTIRLVTTDQADPRSKGKQITISRAVIYQAK